MHALVAPDSFKGTFSAAQVAEAIGRGLEAAGVGTDLCPAADGGEGTLDVLLGALGGRSVAVTVSDPLGRPATAAFGLLDDTAIVEAARACGLGLVAETERDAVAASSFGAGELVVAAVASGARRVLVTVGGTATTDGGAGALAAIEGRGGIGDARLVVLCDVRTPFERAAALFGPQKGAGREAVALLERRLAQFAQTLPRDPRGVAGTGAGGGLAGGLWAAFGARIEPGASWILDALGFDRRLRAVDAVVTGEGRLDEQTAAGKLVAEVAERSRRAGVPLHIVAGSLAKATRRGSRPPRRAAAIALGAASLTLAPTEIELERAGRAIGAHLG